jgi:hypothetical protein
VARFNNKLSSAAMFEVRDDEVARHQEDRNTAREAVASTD